MSKQVSIPRAVMDVAPHPRSASIIAATRSALAQYTPASTVTFPGPFTTIIVPDDLVASIEALDRSRGSVSRYISAAVLGATPAEPAHTPKPIIAAVAITKKQREVHEARQLRLRIASEDAQDGRWARLFITSGSATVDQYRADGDYEDEINSGLVFRSVVPHLPIDEAQEWMKDRMKNRPGYARTHWHYLDADSETISDAKDAALRAAVRMEGGESADLVDQIERSEALQVRLFGHKTGYIRLAKADAELLGERAHPAVLRLARQAKKVLLLG